MLHKTKFLGGEALPGDEEENQRELPTLGMALPKIIHLLKLPQNLDDSVSGTQLESTKKKKKKKWPGSISASGGSDSDHAIPHNPQGQPPLHPTVLGQRS